MKTVLILGGKSDIGQAIAQQYAEHGYSIYLAARHVDSATSFAKNLEIKYQCRVGLYEFDVEDFSQHKYFYSELDPKPMGVICAIGYLGDQEKGQNNSNELLKIVQTNYTGCASILSVAANYLEEQKSGFIVAISSVAGDRGRQSNYLYGSAKAALTCFLSGLRNRLFDKGIQVLTVKPGFVYTKMTEMLNLPSKLTSSKEELAKIVFKAQQRGDSVIYVKRIWWLIMLVISNIPEFIFKRTKL